jgi:hypothetical protein
VALGEREGAVMERTVEVVANGNVIIKDLHRGIILGFEPKPKEHRWMSCLHLLDSRTAEPSERVHTIEHGVN